jgi:Bacterial TSP3 repeat
MKAIILFLLPVIGIGIAVGQSTISSTARYAHAANAGWIDFRADTTSGARVADTTLSGYAYAANFGWIHLGSGTPANGHTYSNTTATDYGVNLSPSGTLTGSAYAANVGWITFEQSYGQPRLDLRTGTFSGSAYSANLGWISLATTFSTLATTTIARPDTDGDGIADSWEMLNFGNLTTATATSDRDGDGASDLAEYNAGTLPTDPASLLRITAHSYPSPTTASLTWTSVPTRNYRLEYDEDLAGPWTNSALGTLAPTGALTSGNLTALTAVPRRFYRAVALSLPTAP